MAVIIKGQFEIVRVFGRLTRNRFIPTYVIVNHQTKEEYTEHGTLTGAIQALAQY